MKHKKMQSVLEYCLFIGILAALLGAIQLYAKRGLNASLKTAGDTLGFQMKTDAGYANETERHLAYLRNATTKGENIVKSASKQSVVAGQIESARVSYSKTSFQGASVSSVLLPRQGDVRRTPDLIDGLVPIQPSELFDIPGFKESFKVYKLISDPASFRNHDMADSCRHLKKEWGIGSGWKDPFSDFQTPSDENCKGGGCGGCDAKMCNLTAVHRSCRETIEYKPYFTQGEGPGNWNTESTENDLRTLQMWKTDPSYTKEYMASGVGRVCLYDKELNFEKFNELIIPELAGGGFEDEDEFKEYLEGKPFYVTNEAYSDSPIFGCKEIRQSDITPHCDARNHRRVQAANRSGTPCDIVGCGKKGYQWDVYKMLRYDPRAEKTVTGAIHEDFYNNLKTKDRDLVLCERSFKKLTENVDEVGCAVDFTVKDLNLGADYVDAYDDLAATMTNSCSKQNSRDLNNLNTLINNISEDFKISWVNAKLASVFSSLVVTAVKDVEVPDGVDGEGKSKTKIVKKIQSYTINRKNPWSGKVLGAHVEKETEPTTDWTAHDPACFKWKTVTCPRDENGFLITDPPCQPKQYRVNECAQEGHPAYEDHKWCTENAQIKGFKVRSNEGNADKGKQLGGGYGGEGGDDQTPYIYYTTLCNIDSMLMSNAEEGPKRKEEVAGYLRWIQAPKNNTAGQSPCRIRVDVDDYGGTSDEDRMHDVIKKEYYIFIPESDEHWPEDDY